MMPLPLPLMNDILANINNDVASECRDKTNRANDCGIFASIFINWHARLMLHYLKLAGNT